MILKDFHELLSELVNAIEVHYSAKIKDLKISNYCLLTINKDDMIEVSDIELLDNQLIFPKNTQIKMNVLFAMLKNITHILKYDNYKYSDFSLTLQDTEYGNLLRLKCKKTSYFYYCDNFKQSDYYRDYNKIVDSYDVSWKVDENIRIENSKNMHIALNKLKHETFVM